MADRNFFSKLIKLERKNKISIIVFFDFFMSLAAFVLAFILIYEQLPGLITNSKIWLIALGVSLFSVILFFFQRLYKDVFRFIGLRSFVKLVIGISASSIYFYILTLFILSTSPKRLIVLYAMIFSIMATTVRLIARILLKVLVKNNKDAERILIYGAGESGNQVMQMMKNSSEFKPVGYIDDDVKKHGLKVDGLNIYSSVDAPFIAEKLKVDTILLALPSVKRSKRRDIIFQLEDCNVRVKTLPHIDEIMHGNLSIADIQNIDITELLGREPVEPNQNLFSRYIENQTVMVTGGAGSIGSELCRQILKSKPNQLIILDNSEYSLYMIEQELTNFIKTEQLDTELVPILGNVKSKLRLSSVFKYYKIDTIYHAAAYKHVPMVEQNIVEGITNNIFGTLNVAQMAISYGVSQFTLISTDKAVRPTNVMGASKRMAELVLQALANESHSTCFSMVRFGNVLGSSGSVVPLFKKQIEAGGPLTVTDPGIIRFFMTIPEAAQLVIQAGAMAKGGEVYVLDMGAPVRIYDLACQMVNLAGLTIRDAANPDGDIEITFSGLRPGEKLYEELLIGDNIIETSHKRISAAKEICLTWQNFENILDDVKTACDSYDIESLHKILNEAPVGYNHSGAYVDLVKTQTI